jgi:DNA-binding NtrC family response regulator
MAPPDGGLILLIVEDDPAVRGLLVKTFTRPGLAIVTAADGAEARAAIAARRPNVVILDLGLPDVPGVELLSEALAASPRPMVIVLTGRADQPTVVEAMRRGAMEYVVKPFDPDALEALVDKAFRQAAQAGTGDAQVTVASVPKGVLVGKSRKILEVYKLIGMFAASDVPVLITGESGTGKELVARALHQFGPNPDGPFIVVDCSSLPSSLLEAELFGHEKGAFTGAETARAGRFELANGGTIFLDEAGNIPVEIQPKLLRVLQERTVQRLGSAKSVAWNARIVSASNVNLWDLAKSGRYREDLLYRLAGAEINLPPLRERLEDLEDLAGHFLAESGRENLRLSASAMERLKSYAWPGNVRELKHALDRAVALARGSVIEADHLPDKIRGLADSGPVPIVLPSSKPDVLPLEALKRRYARQILELCVGNKSEAARLLGIDRSTLYELLTRDGDPGDNR